MIKKIKHRMQSLWRQRRMQEFLKRMHLQNGTRIIDLGGLPQIWETIDLDLDLVLLNLPGILEKTEKIWQGKYQFIEADACELQGLPDNSFDVVFSNSVIEHIGSPEKQEVFAKTVQRLAPSYWIQTPSIWFPIEAHCDLPFWWFYPSKLKQAWILEWQRRGLKFKSQQMAETRVLSLSYLKSLFPDAQVYTEYVAGFPKSYSMYVPIDLP
ncbi:MAG: methyltransferase domain-containing protein [Cyanosarcina radialis HA8281-LM2]|jgi:hypothetical protein|nr:methyltransferase domain-containing protein [Cyanosarcina radialis HA8281-LM2]